MDCLTLLRVKKSRLSKGHDVRQTCWPDSANEFRQPERVTVRRLAFPTLFWQHLTHAQTFSGPSRWALAQVAWISTSCSGAEVTLLRNTYWNALCVVMGLLFYGSLALASEWPPGLVLSIEVGDVYRSDSPIIVQAELRRAAGPIAREGWTALTGFLASDADLVFTNIPTGMPRAFYRIGVVRPSVPDPR